MWEIIILDVITFKSIKFYKTPTFLCFNFHKIQEVIILKSPLNPMSCLNLIFIRATYIHQTCKEQLQAKFLLKVAIYILLLPFIWTAIRNKYYLKVLLHRGILAKARTFTIIKDNWCSCYPKWLLIGIKDNFKNKFYISVLSLQKLNK